MQYFFIAAWLGLDFHTISAGRFNSAVETVERFSCCAGSRDIRNIVSRTPVCRQCPAAHQLFRRFPGFFTRNTLHSVYKAAPKVGLPVTLNVETALVRRPGPSLRAGRYGLYWAGFLRVPVQVLVRVLLAVADRDSAAGQPGPIPVCRASADSCPDRACRPLCQTVYPVTRRPLRKSFRRAGRLDDQPEAVSLAASSSSSTFATETTAETAIPSRSQS